MAFRDEGEEIAFFSRVVGVGMIIASPLTGPFAPAMIGIGGAAIAGASVGSKIANRTTRKRRAYKPSTEEKVSSTIAGSVNLAGGAHDVAETVADILDKHK